MAHPVIHLFNPENDLAIANNGDHYMAPPAARAIAYDLSCLPVWYADESEQVLTDNKIDLSDFSQLGSFPLQVGAGGIGDRPSEFVPWGWSNEIYHRLLRYGVDKTMLPTPEELAGIRACSHRSVTIKILDYLRESGYELLPAVNPIRLRTATEVKSFLESAFRTVLKAPWSGSGKGLSWGRGVYDTTLERWSNGILRRQGEIIGEPYYDKVVDFAMEFYSNGNGKVDFAGYSYFLTDKKGVYKENFLASDRAIAHKLGHFIPVASLQNLQMHLSRILALFLNGIYKGYLGIDMMIYEEKNVYHLHPCVEMNLRMNMGMVSRLFYDRFVMPGTEGCYCVDFVKEPGKLFKDHIERQKRYPIVIENGRLKSGYLSLSPVTENTQYRARVELNSESFQFSI